MQLLSHYVHCSIGDTVRHEGRRTGQQKQAARDTSAKDAKHEGATQTGDGHTSLESPTGDVRGTDIEQK